MRIVGVRLVAVSKPVAVAVGVCGTGVVNSVVLQPDLVVGKIVVEQDRVKLPLLKRTRRVVAVPPVDALRLLPWEGVAREV
jgi:hypothetical protein